MVALPLLLSLGRTWAGELSGLIEDAGGEPLVGAVVYAYDLRLEGRAVLTDVRGQYRITDLPAGAYRLVVRPDDADNALSRFYPDHSAFCDSPLLTLDTPESSLSDLDFRLPVGGELSGLLRDAGGAPVLEGQVIARSLPDTATDGAFEREASTDGGGRFLLRGLEGGPWALEVRGDRLPTQYLGAVYAREEAFWLEATPGSLDDVGEHRLLSGITVQGGVFGPPDVSVAGASVIVYAGGQVRTALAGKDGHYEASGLPPGDVLVWSEPPGLALTYLPDQDRPTTVLSAPEEGMVLEGVDLFPPLPASLTVTVADARTGEAIAGASVTLYNDNQSVAKGAPAPEGVATLEGLHGGDYVLYVFAASAGFTNGWILDEETGEKRIFALDDEEDAAVTVLLSPAGQVRGVITDEDGAPVYGATVTLHSEAGGASTETDLDGAFSLVGLPAGDWSLQVDHAFYCAADPGWVTVYWPGEVYGAEQTTLSLAEAEVREVALVLPRDDDHDGMGDRWESRHGLDPTRDDSQEDPDGDGATNLWEYWLGTDPHEADQVVRTCGCRSSAGGSGAFLLLLLPLSHAFTRRR